MAGAISGDTEAWSTAARIRSAGTLEGAETHDLEVEDTEGRFYTARLHGTLIAEDGPVCVYLGKDEKIYVYFDPDSRLHQDVAASELRNWLADGAYTEAMHALGEEVVIDIGLPG